MGKHLIGPLLKPGFLGGLSWDSYFFIYIKDIVKNIGCSIRLFADDTSLYIIEESALIAANLINTDLDTISTWAAN